MKARQLTAVLVAACLAVGVVCETAHKRALLEATETGIDVFDTLSTGKLCLAPCLFLAVSLDIPVTIAWLDLISLPSLRGSGLPKFAVARAAAPCCMIRSGQIRTCLMKFHCLRWCRDTHCN